MSDLIPQLARQTLTRSTERTIAPKAIEKAAEKAFETAAKPTLVPEVTKRVEQAAEKAFEKTAAKTTLAPEVTKRVEKAAEKAVEKTAAKTTLTPEVTKRLAQLMDTNAAVVLPSEASQLISMASLGKLTPEAKLTLGNVSQHVAQEGGFAAVVLSDEGKKALAMAEKASGIDAAFEKLAQPNFANSGLRFGAETTLPVSLDLGKSVKHVLIDAQDHPTFLKQYGQAVTEGKAPASIGGKPFFDFFKASDDLYNDLEVEAFQRSVPGFAQRPLEEQKAVASLASRVAADFNPAVPASTRRKVAATMVSYMPIEGAQGTQAIGELKAFYKGVPGGKGIGDSIANEGLKVGEAGRYGKGVYHTPSPTTAAGYTYKNTTTPAEIVSGEVAPGHLSEGYTNAVSFDQDAAVDTRWIRRAQLDKADYGDYGVTKDPTRFQIKAITRYRPDQAQGLDNLIPDLLEAHTQAPSWTAKLFDQIDPARRQRAFDYALQNGTPEARQSAAFLLARSGDARGIKTTIETLRGATDTKTVNAAGEALRGTFKLLGGDRTPEAGAVLQALSGSSYLKGKESSIAQEVEAGLGETGTKLLQENGWKKVSGPRTYWSR